MTLVRLIDCMILLDRARDFEKLGLSEDELEAAVRTVAVDIVVIGVDNFENLFAAEVRFVMELAIDDPAVHLLDGIYSDLAEQRLVEYDLLVAKGDSDGYTLVVLEADADENFVAETDWEAGLVLEAVAQAVLDTDTALVLEMADGTAG